MSTNIPVNPSQPGWTPSGSTIGTTVGGAIAVVIVSLLEGNHISVSGSLAAAITTLCGVLAGYLPASGRK